MAEAQEKADRKEKKPSLNHGTVDEFLGSWKKPVPVDDTMNFNFDEAIPKGNKKTFNLENLETDLNLDGARRVEHALRSTPSQFLSGSDSIQFTTSDIQMVDYLDSGAVTKSEEEEERNRSHQIVSGEMSIRNDNKLRTSAPSTTSDPDRESGERKETCCESTAEGMEETEPVSVGRGTEIILAGKLNDCALNEDKQKSSYMEHRENEPATDKVRVTEEEDKSVVQSTLLFRKSEDFKTSLASSAVHKPLFGSSGLSMKQLNRLGSVTRSGDVQTGRNLLGQLKPLSREIFAFSSSGDIQTEEKNVSLDTVKLDGNVSKGDKSGDAMIGSECAVPDGGINLEVMTAVVPKSVCNSWSHSRDDSKGSEALGDRIDVSAKTVIEKIVGATWEDMNEESSFSDEGIPIDQRAEHAKSHGEIDSIEGTKLGLEDFSEDVLKLVLLNLSTRELLQKKCVSTQWRDLISSRNFMLHHSKKQTHMPEVTGFFLQTYGLWIDSDPSELKYFSKEGEGANLIQNGMLELIPQGCTIASSCNGLVCCKRATARTDIWMISVGSPVTGEWMEIQWDAAGQERGVALLFDPFCDTNDYKVVMLWQREGEKGYTFHVYNSGTSSWKESAKVSAKSLVEFSVHPRRRASVKGVVYFYTDGDVLLAFDAGKELAYMIEKPYLGADSRHIDCVGESDGTELRYVVVEPERLNVWGLKGEEEEEWELLLKVRWATIENFEFSSQLEKRKLLSEPLAYKDDVLVVKAGEKVFCYDCRKQGGMKLVCGVLDLPHIPIVIPYAMSFVSITQGSECQKQFTKTSPRG